MHGRKGKKRLDSNRMSLVRRLTYQLRPLKPGEKEEENWRKTCTVAIDTANHKQCIYIPPSQLVNPVDYCYNYKYMYMSMTLSHKIDHLIARYSCQTLTSLILSIYCSYNKIILLK